MLLKTLTLTNIRAFSHAEITFQPGMNLIVGINGVGKSTILDALRILLSQALPRLSQSRSKAHQFQGSDITIDQLDFQAKLTFDIAKTGCIALVSNKQIPSDTYPDSIAGILERQLVLPRDPEVIAELKNAPQQPLALYFSTRRAFLDNTKSLKSYPGLAASFKDSLTHRGLKLPEFVDWFFAQKQLVLENAPNAQSHLNAFETAVVRFMDTCGDLSVQRDSDRHQPKKGTITRKFQSTFLIQKSGIQLDISQLSDGERGILALVLDLARRLSQANPTLDDPLQAQAVVLIDELDLHLHPQWQRSIVSKLTTTFPNCQFIATTHSPLIIGEVAPESVILIAENGEIIHPNQSLGMDTDWILKYIMGAATRETETTQRLERISDLIEAEEYDEASDAIDMLREAIGEFPELVRLQTRIDRLQMLGG